MEALGASKVFPQIQNESKKQKKKIEDGPRTIFGQFLAIFIGSGIVLGGPGGPESGSKTGSVCRVRKESNFY